MADFVKTSEFSNSNEILGIAVGHIKKGFLHNKILFRLKGEVKEIHLGWHHYFIHQDIEALDSFIWRAPKLPNSRLRSVAAKCQIVAENQKKNKKNEKAKLPYAIGYYSGREFDENGIYTDNKGVEYGMTCATFVLTIFKSVGIELVHWEDWTKGRPDDKRWFKYIISKLEEGVKDGIISQEHLNNVKGEKKCARYRPEEIFAATFCSNRPSANFKCCESIGIPIKNYTLKLPNQY